MKQFDPFPKVSTKYGAPMGRRSDNMHGIKRYIFDLTCATIIAALFALPIIITLWRMKP